MNALKEWFNGLAPRERVMVSVAAVVVALTMFYYLLWAPLNGALADARQRARAEASEARWMLGIENEAQRLRAAGDTRPTEGRDQSMLSIIDASSRANQLGEAVTQIQPRNDEEAVVNLDRAGFDTLVVWLASLQRRYGIVVEEATISRESDHPGEVEARLTLTRQPT